MESEDSKKKHQKAIGIMRDCPILFLNRPVGHKLVPNAKNIIKGNLNRNKNIKKNMQTLIDHLSQ